MHRTSLAIIALGALLLAAPGCEPESSNPPNPNKCNATTCPDGCCSLSGVCELGTSVNACGSSGQQCQSCGALNCIDQVCKDTSGPTCSPSNCGGCCSGDQCLPGNTQAACGRDGLACQPCSGSETCAAGTCGQVCNATTCPDGCCKNGVCFRGTQQSVQACGTGGQACIICGNGEQCISNVCKATACDSSNCAGCCDPGGNCRNGSADGACGAGGQACSICDTSKNQSCMNGGCQTVNPGCNATTCPNGCCDDTGQCVPGTASNNCGGGGNACSQCGSNLACVNQKCACTSTSCPGCCDGDICKAGSDINACGTAGGACQKCTGTTKCVSGTCQNDCSYLTCAGCCNGTTCIEPANSSNCGAYGKQCSQCGGAETCTKGTCNDSSQCSKTNCPTGCCKGGQCQGGNLDGACGEAGNVCELCGDHLYCGTDPFYGTKECLARATSTWDVIVVKVELNPNPASPWDSFLENPPPDVFVEVTVGNKTGKTSKKDNQFTPVFDDYVLTATAADLGTKISYKIYDKDVFGADLIGSCSDVVYPAELKDGKLFLNGCPGDPNNKDVLKISFKFVVKGK